MEERCTLYNENDIIIAVVYKAKDSSDLILYDNRLFYHNSELEAGTAFREIKPVTDFEVTWKA